MSRGLSALVTGLAVFAISLAAALTVLPTLFDLERYVITGGSMEPTIHKGAIVFDRVAPVASLRVGDIVTFAPPGHSSQVTHRIVAVNKDDTGQPVFRTRGDANRYGDPWQVAFPGPVQARYWFSIPYLGYLLGILSFRSVRMLVLALPALLIGISFLVSVWRDIAQERREERLGAHGAVGGES